MATNGSEKRMVKRAERKMARSAKKAGRVQRTAKTRRAIGDFIVQKRSIVPNMITMSNMTMGFFAIILASRGDKSSLALAGIMVFVGTLFDAIDGAVARAMHVESPVGVQLDSLADGIAYGIAPAVIAYQGYLSQLPQEQHVHRLRHADRTDVSDMRDIPARALQHRRRRKTTIPGSRVFLRRRPVS